MPIPFGFDKLIVEAPDPDEYEYEDDEELLLLRQLVSAA